jgi:hypothetical protein
MDGRLQPKKITKKKPKHLLPARITIKQSLV